MLILEIFVIFCAIYFLIGALGTWASWSNGSMKDALKNTYESKDGQVKRLHPVSVSVFVILVWPAILFQNIRYSKHPYVPPEDRIDNVIDDYY